MPAVVGKVRREYRLVIRRSTFPDDVHPLWSARNVYNYARNLKRYWQRQSGDQLSAQVQVREVTGWRPL